MFDKLELSWYNNYFSISWVYSKSWCWLSPVFECIHVPLFRLLFSKWELYLSGSLQQLALSFASTPQDNLWSTDTKAWLHELEKMPTDLIMNLSHNFSVLFCFPALKVSEYLFLPIYCQTNLCTLISVWHGSGILTSSPGASSKKKEGQ